MTNDEFMNMYGNYLEHKWVSSKDAAKAAQQKKAEQAYNAKYYKEHREEILNNRRRGQAPSPTKPISREEALAKLNAQQQGIPNNKDSHALVGTRGMSDEIKQARIKQYMQQYGIDKAEATKRLANELRAERTEEFDINLRNARAAEMARNQGAQQQANYEYKKNEQNKKDLAKQAFAEARRVETGQAQGAQQRANYVSGQIANRNRTAANAKEQSDWRHSSAQKTARRNTAASEAQTAAARNRRGAVVNREISKRNAYASNAQMMSNARRSDASKSLTNKITRVINRASKKTSDLLNKGRAAVQSVRDTINSTSAQINKAKTSVQRTLAKYFG